MQKSLIILFLLSIFIVSCVQTTTLSDDKGTIGDIEELDMLATQAIMGQQTEQTSAYDRHYVTFIWNIKNTQYSGESYYFLIDFCTKTDFTDCFQMKASNTAYHTVGDEYTVRIPVQIINNFDNPNFCSKDLYVVASHYVCSEILGGGFCYEDGYPSSYGSDPIHWECPYVCNEGDRECTSSSSYKICQNNDWSSSLVCPSSAPSCNDGNCVDLCFGIDCNDNNICTTDTCSGGECSYSATNNGAVCGTGKICSNGNCITNAECSSNSDCNDDNLCTDDLCTTGKCSNTAKSCATGYSCNPDNGNCEQNPACESDQDCDDNDECTTDKCVNSICQYTQIPNCIPSCKAYQELKDGKCKFSLGKLFTGDGFKAFYEDYTTEIIVSGIILVIIIVLVLYLLFKPKEDLGGF